MDLTVLENVLRTMTDPSTSAAFQKACGCNAQELCGKIFPMLPEYVRQYLEKSPQLCQRLGSTLNMTAKEFLQMEKDTDKYEERDLNKIMRNFPPERRSLLSSSFKCQTYTTIIDKVNETMTLKISPQYQHQVDMVIAAQQVADVEERNVAAALDIVGIVAQVIIFCMNVIGIPLASRKDKILDLTKLTKVGDNLRKINACTSVIKEIKEAYAKRDMFKVAKQITCLIIEIFKQGLVWDVVKVLLSDGDEWEYVKLCGQLAMMYIGLISKGAVATVILHLIQAIMDFGDLGREIPNLFKVHESGL